MDWRWLEGLGSWPRMVSGCGSFLKLLKQEILLWMTHKDPLSGGGWGGRKKLFPVSFWVQDDGGSGRGG